MVEFAVLAPVFLMLLFGIIELSRMLWTQQALQEIASSTSRCFAVGTCTNLSTPNTTAYAVARANDWGIAIATGEVAPQQGDLTGQGCKTFTASSPSSPTPPTPPWRRVVITHPFGSVLNKLLPMLPATLTASACFPVVNSS